MKNYSIPIPAFAVFIAVLIIQGCAGNSRWEEESAKLLRQAVELEYRHSHLNGRIDSLWDDISIKLEKSLPPDFPPIDRDIFIHARNADHIRMFMSFKELDPGIQELVNEAGEFDKVLAAEVQELLSQRQEFEKQKNEFLRTIEQKNASVSQLYADKFLEIGTEPIQ